MSVNNSYIGLLNTGTIDQVSDLMIQVAGLIDSGNGEFAEALRSMTEALASDLELDQQQHQEALSLLVEIGRQAELPDEKRSNRAVLRSVFASLAAIVALSGGAAETWSVVGPHLQGFFGL